MYKMLRALRASDLRYMNIIQKVKNVTDGIQVNHFALIDN